MPKEKLPPPPPEDIPAWFMTYSDVITLLMTFFILLLTFATTEPDRFERVQQSVANGGSGTGQAGDPILGPEYESWVQRVRPRAARMAMEGSEIPPTFGIPRKRPFRKAMKKVTQEEAQQDVMASHRFEVTLDKIVDQDSNLTSEGVFVAEMLARQLKHLPVHLLMQFADPGESERGRRFRKSSVPHRAHSARSGRYGNR